MCVVGETRRWRAYDLQSAEGERSVGRCYEECEGGRTQAPAGRSDAALEVPTRVPTRAHTKSFTKSLRRSRYIQALRFRAQESKTLLDVREMGGERGVGLQRCLELGTNVRRHGSREIV